MTADLKISTRFETDGLLAEVTDLYPVSAGRSLPVCGFQVMGRARLAFRSNTCLLIDLHAFDTFRLPVNWKGVAAAQKITKRENDTDVI